MKAQNQPRLLVFTILKSVNVSLSPKLSTLLIDWFPCFKLSNFLSVHPCVEMEESRRRAYNKAQATKKKQETPKATGQAHSSNKRKPSEKVDHPPKRPKVVTEPTVGEATTGKLSLKPDMRKGLMTGGEPLTKKPLVLLCKDSQYALQQISSIIKDGDYEDLGNHATEAVGEIGYFYLTQACIHPLYFIHPIILYTNTFLTFVSGGNAEGSNGSRHIP